jgi:hypothetical protein
MSIPPLYCNNRSQQDITGRTELQESPYQNGVTQQQLNMRRKAEILKYNSTKSSTQTNGITKNQLFSKIVTTNYRPCSVDANNKPMPTNASNIPGPVMYLFENPNVKLYNYKNVTLDRISGNSNTNITNT